MFSIVFASYWSLIVSSVIGVSGIFYLWAKWKHSYWQRRGIPSLPTNIIFGNFKDAIMMKIAPGYLLGRLYREIDDDAPFVGFYIMHRPYLLLRSPEIIKHVLVKDFNAFSDRLFAAPETSRDLVGSRGLFSIKNPQWRYLRTKLSPAFTSGKIKSLFVLMLESADSLKNYMERRFGNGEGSLDFKDASSRYTTDVISSLAFGVRTDSFQDPPPEFYVRSRYPFGTNIVRTLQLFMVFFFPKITNFVSGSMLGEHTDFFRKIFWSSMDSRENGKYERGDVIDSLLKIKNEKTEVSKTHEFELDGDTLVAQSALFFVAGLETSATTIAFALWELAKNPDVQERARRDINEHLDDSKNVTYESIQEMKYLMSVINETLRMYPPAPLIDRVANRDYKLPGTQDVVEKGTVVYVGLPGPHMDPKYHPNPEVYDPDRFSDERKNDIKPFTFMPFGEGPRACIGLRIGMLLTAVGLITVLRNHEVSLGKDEWKNRVSTRAIFTSPANGITLNVKKISQAA